VKKFLGLLISSLAIISLVSCKNPKQSSDSKENEQSSVPPISYSSSLEEPSSGTSEISSEDIPSSNVETYYHVTFVNYDDTLLYEVDVLKGNDAEYKGETPVKPEDDEFTDEFVGWDKELTNIQSETTFKAEYKPIAKEGWGSIIWF
jgi:hypothetical protein